MLIDTDKIYDLLPEDFKPEDIVLMGYRGSIAHGTYILNHIDDIDVLGCIMPPPKYVFGLDRFEQIERFQDSIDLVVYDFRKTIRLLLGSNPNVMSLLWLNPEHYIYYNRIGYKLKTHRHLFLSKQVYKTYGGYAHGQLKRMTHYKFEGYMGQKRKALVDKFGYDTKNAAHLIRLLNMGIEMLSEGTVNVYRPDAQLYINIKQGLFTLDEIKGMAETKFKILDEAYAESELPEQPETQTIKNLVLEWMLEYYGENKEKYVQ